MISSAATHFPTLQTERLILRPWRHSDFNPFAAINCDPRVMRHFPSVLSRDESNAMVAVIQAHFETHGFGFWAVEAPGVADLIGMIGLSIPRIQAPFMPCVEVGWRLGYPHWSKGYATEGARAAIQFGFEALQLNEILAFTVPANTASRRVMNKLGMHHCPDDDFDHPRLPPGHPLQRHVLYRLPKSDWQADTRG